MNIADRFDDQTTFNNARSELESLLQSFDWHFRTTEEFDRYVKSSNQWRRIKQLTYNLGLVGLTLFNQYKPKESETGRKIL
jgi:hypothetical protein